LHNEWGTQCPHISQIRIKTGIGTPNIHSSMYLIIDSSKLVFAPLRGANVDTIRSRLDCSLLGH